MGDMTFKEVLDLIPGIGVTTLLFLVLYGGYKRWWVFGWQYDFIVSQLNICIENASEREKFLKNLNQVNSNATDRAIRIAQQKKS